MLLVDDMVDSGHTLEAVYRTLPDALPAHYGHPAPPCSGRRRARSIKPDYYVDHLADNPWIHQPFEIYDTLRPEALRARLALTRRAASALDAAQVHERLA